MNEQLFLYIHGFAGQSAWGDSLIIFFGEWYLYVVLAIFVAAALWEWLGWGPTSLYRYGIAAVAALLARFALTPLIRAYYIHPRPFIELGTSHLLADTSSSFPSGHTIFIFALGAATHFFNKRLAYFLYISGLVIGVARIMGGVHWPLDILGGIVLGLLVGAGIYALARKLF